MTRVPDRVRRTSWLAALALLIAFSTTHLDVDNSITQFMPSGEEAEFAAVSRSLIDSGLSRTMVLSIGGNARLELAAGLAESLAAHPEVAAVRAGLDDAQLQALHGLYFSRLAYFVSEHPTREIPARLSPEGLATSAERLRTELARPSSSLYARLAPGDPLAVFPDVIERFRGSQPGLGMEQGQFVSADGGHAIIFLETRSSAFDSASQEPLLSLIEQRFRELDAAHGGGHVLEQSGVNRIAVHTEHSMRGDIRFISILSFVGVSGLFLLFFRSPRSLLIAMFPPLFGITFATACGILTLHPLHGVTVGFGVALIGVAIDYPIHLMNHHSLLGPAALLDAAARARATVARLWPSLALGASTTMTSFLALTLTTFPGVGEMGIFAALGIGAALLATLFALPLFLPALPAPPEAQLATARQLGRFVSWLAASKWLAAPPLLAACIAAIGLPRLEWQDDPSYLTSLDPALQAEDTRVRERVSQFDAGRFVIAVAEQREAAIELNDRVWLRLAEAIEAGVLEDARSLHAMLWSQKLQRENLALLRAEPDLARRIDESFRAAGFRSGAFQAFADSLQSSELPPPLRFEDLAGSPIGAAARSLLVELGDRHAAITYLRGVRDPDAIRRALSDLQGAHYFDQQELMREIYTGYRTATLRVVILGSLLVFLVLLLRYRSLRPALAAFLPSVLVALTSLGLFALFGLHVNLLGLVSLILVMGMGVDYCIFMVDSTRDARHLGATMTSLLFSCLTTIFVFGILAVSAHPALRSIGLTTGVGILLAFVLAPSALLLSGRRPAPAGATGGSREEMKEGGERP